MLIIIFASKRTTKLKKNIELQQETKEIQQRDTLNADYDSEIDLQTVEEDERSNSIHQEFGKLYELVEQNDPLTANMIDIFIQYRADKDFGSTISVPNNELCNSQLED